jgi:2-desacetyl-2-hydroxyethyl bacteriochlorophyllide A dehydrogenase
VERRSLYYLSPGVVEVRSEVVPDPDPNQVLVRTRYSAISPGTEMLLYRGQFPDGIALDESIPSLSGGVNYPLKYGYAQVGEIIQVGSEVDQRWIGKNVFAFHPHSSCFVSGIQDLQIIPDGLKLEDALFFANMETAVGFAMDGGPAIGERVVVFGQGIVGLLTTSLLATYPLESLVTLDHLDLRRRASLDMGADRSLDPGKANYFSDTNLKDEGGLVHKADLVYELTGNPAVLNHAIEAAAYEGKIIVGSWYGKKEVHLELGGWFHRGRLKLISSQVSRINSTFSARWEKERRYELTWEMLRQVKPSRLITHTIPIEDAKKAFDLLDKKPGDAIQVIFEY